MYIEIEADEYKTRFKDVNAPHLLLDVRTPEEYEQARIPGAQSIPLDDLPQRLAEIPRDLPIVVVCRSGMRSLIGIQILKSAGFENELLNFEGGTLAWARHQWPLERG